MKTETTNQSIDILSEDFNIPDCTIDLMELIESSIDYYNSMSLGRYETKMFRFKVNELIDELNERRGMRIYNHIH